MDGSNRLAIDDIYDTLVEVRDKASHEGAMVCWYT